MKSDSPGPIASKLVSAVRHALRARVLDLAAYRQGMADAADLQKTVATQKELAALHPAHALYAYAQNQVSILSEQITSLREVRKLAEPIGAAEDEYMPSGPPMSPLTPSYFTCWAFFDAAVGPRRETIGTCVLAIGRELGMPAGLLDLISRMQQSRMGVYACEGQDSRGRTLLRDLYSGDRKPCHVPSGWTGRSGELWLARVFEPPQDGLEEYIVFTTPYVLRGVTEAMWMDYFRRRLGASMEDRPKAESMLKFDVEWSEYIFQGYAGHVMTAIFLTGILDDPSSLPHA